MEKYTFISDYKEDSELRASLEALAEKTFGIRFEEWYRHGFWGDGYIPYSVMDGRKVVSNVSVNRMPFTLAGKKKYFIQLGTVMTDKDYRGQGLNRQLLTRILEEYKDSCDGIYLFANNSVLEYYPKFGFQRALEYRYQKNVKNSGKREAVLQPMAKKEDYVHMAEVIRKSCPNSSLEMDNTGLFMFYLTYFMKESLYYIEPLKAYAIAEIEQETLYLHHILSEREVEVDKVIEAFGEGIQKAVLGFSPLSADGFEREVLKEEDTTLFILGEGWEDFLKEQLRFPVLSHA